ncbi:preprotein translocase subunit SecE [Salisediminibacterium selenitireducens]|uniref:Protein translocase subunit SecE n=1 Tax=Bacillus selenitireducens (strain ATCC 700615 / DSM 15326 / MLS10) TaxID=439292 RepID=D6XV90_BACIE|nr:preprotein translocase subunit SecE [Salisediminibacterium selenitireducens]ADH97648.1 preprotein translocase, SecE subunit [[Bacillus] selenitireducens MLS10]
MAEQEQPKSKNPIKFLKDVSTEMKRVTWPNRQELTKYTIVVSTTVIIMAIFFAISDFAISGILDLITN